jgi:hypothetical protein
MYLIFGYGPAFSAKIRRVAAEEDVDRDVPHPAIAGGGSSELQSRTREIERGIGSPDRG